MDIRAQVVWQAGSFLPEDRFVNTLHFVSTQPSLELAAAELHPLVSGFYTVIPAGGGTGTITSYYSGFIFNGECRYYDLADPMPRVPVVSAITRTGASASATIPEECAVVLSLRAVPPVTARRRGRLYLGPMNDAAGTAATGGLPVRVEQPLIENIRLAANALRTGVTALGAGNYWAIRSTLGAGTPASPAPAMVEVDGGWVDNAWDTQRRRGPDATSRTLWGNPL